MEKWQLRQMQSLPLEVKILKTQLRIKEWYEHWDDEVYVAYSGGKDSEVLLDLVRSLYPEVEGVFVHTGLEFPEVVEHVKEKNNITILKPKMGFREVIKKYGYPVVSKEQSKYIHELQVTHSEKMWKLRMEGKNGSWKISEKWKYLIDAPFKISDQCCNVMKKKPFKDYEKHNDKHPFIGTLASESRMRMRDWVMRGCNAFDLKNPSSKPLSFWSDEDIWNYIKQRNLTYSSIYDKGWTQTGCMFCMYGVHLEREPNRFQRMQKTHPKIYKYCMEELGLKEVLEYMRIPYKEGQLSLYDHL